MMCLHVDDFYVVSTQQNYLDDLHEKLEAKFGDVSIKSNDVLTYLGMVIKKNDKAGGIFICQSGHIEQLLQQVDLSGVKFPTSAFSSINDVATTNSPKVNRTNYLRLVGGINYLAQYTRPDLLYALSRVAQECQRPTKADMKKVLRLLKYIEKTKHYGIRFSSDTHITLICHVDASYNCYDDGKGHYGYSFSLGESDGVFFAKSSKLKLQTLSSTESEYVALCEAAKEVAYLRRVLKFLGFAQKKPTVVYEDNKSCIEMVKGNINHKVNKHISPKYHFVRQQQEKRKIVVKFKKTNDMVADLLTKGLSKVKTDLFTQKMLNM
jgi:hypothetical protein